MKKIYYNIDYLKEYLIWHLGTRGRDGLISGGNQNLVEGVT